MGSPHWFVLTGTRSAAERVRLLVLVRERASSVKRLADDLGLECETVDDHLEVLLENDLVEERERDGVALYRPSLQARQHWDAIGALLEQSPAVAAEDPAQIRSR